MPRTKKAATGEQSQAPETQAPKPSKQETLRKLAQKRVPKAVKAIEVCGNLAAYKPTPAQADAIVQALSAALTATKNRLSGAKTGSGSFALPEEPKPTE